MHVGFDSRLKITILPKYDHVDHTKAEIWHIISWVGQAGISVYIKTQSILGTNVTSFFAVHVMKSAASYKCCTIVVASYVHVIVVAETLPSLCLIAENLCTLHWSENVLLLKSENWSLKKTWFSKDVCTSEQYSELKKMIKCCHNLIKENF